MWRKCLKINFLDVYKRQYVNGIMGKAMVDGYQQKADTGIAACLKHFAGYRIQLKEAMIMARTANVFARVDVYKRQGSRETGIIKRWSSIFLRKRKVSSRL